VSGALWNQNPAFALSSRLKQEVDVNSIIWIVGAVVIIIAILSFFGLR
jgi:hypothetical protein